MYVRIEGLPHFEVLPDKWKNLNATYAFWYFWKIRAVLYVKVSLKQQTVANEMVGFQGDAVTDGISCLGLFEDFCLRFCLFI